MTEDEFIESMKDSPSALAQWSACGLLWEAARGFIAAAQVNLPEADADLLALEVPRWEDAKWHQRVGFYETVQRNNVLLNLSATVSAQLLFSP